MKQFLTIALWAGLPFVLLGLSARVIKRSWLAPGPFFVLYWGVACVGPLVLSPCDKVSAGAVCWIFLSTLTVLLGDFVGAVGRKEKEVRTQNVVFSGSQVSFISSVVICCSIVGLISFVIVLNSAVQNLGSLLSMEELLNVARKIASHRYDRTYRPFLSQLLNMFLYAGPLFGGILVAISQRRRYVIIAALPILPALLMTAVFTLRGFTIISILLWISSYLGTRVLLGRYQLFTKRHVIVGLLVVVLSFSIVTGARFARRGSIDKRSIAAAYVDARTCAFGHIAVFSNWFDRKGLEVNNPLLGAYTFAGIVDLLGIREREVGLFTEAVTLSSGDTSTIYTVFRVLIEDFTFLGSLFVLFLVAFLASRVYQRVLQEDARTMPILAAFYATVLWSFCTSIWIWNSIIAAFVLFAAGFLIILDLHAVKSLLGTLYSRFDKVIHPSKQA
jgi:oligosaccharide repeat unit polymerase